MFQRRDEWVLRLGTLGILVLVGALYAPTLGYKFVSDDELLVNGRVDYWSPSRWLEAVRQPLDFSPNYFRPLALSSLLVQLWLWGDNPAPFHAANVLIHLLNTAAGVWVGGAPSAWALAWTAGGCSVRSASRAGGERGVCFLAL